MFMEKYYRATLKQINKVTLIEVVCTVLILIILAALMYPNYQSYILKAHRMSVMSDLTQLQLELEQHHQNSYLAISNTLIGADGVCHLCKTEPERFALSILVKEYGYSIVAQAKGEQLNDHCSGESYQYLSLNHRGRNFSRALLVEKSLQIAGFRNELASQIIKEFFDAIKKAFRLRFMLCCRITTARFLKLFQ